MCLIIDKEKDYYRACKGFSINGIAYRRLLGTNGGIKNSTIVFVSERYAGELARRIDNGRDMSRPLVPAKLEAYKALTCSASIPVSLPRGILVVNDCETEFTADTIYLTDENVDEPTMEERKGSTVELDESDGYGIMLPSLAARWSEELGLDYVVSGVNTRFSFEKGMIFTFDFVDFADKVSKKYEVVDAWGNYVDVRNVEIILTTSMVKLWDSYKSCDDYVQSCLDNGYTFGVAKTCPRELESERTLNYQFIQSYDLTDEDIEKLVSSTKEEIEGVLGGDWAKTVLFMKGNSINENNISDIENGFLKAVMIDHRMMDDPYIRTTVYQLIRNRINEAKVGALNVHGNYSIVSGDPYSLCQSMFGLPVTGLLKSGEIYNKYWSDAGAKELACFRAPMTCHNNIRKVHPCTTVEASYWYQYMTTCTVFNSWDTSAHALNGMDKDGDLVMLTDNEVLVSKLVELPALMCVQRKAPKIVGKELDFVKSNIESFGNDIGKTTNWITSMFEVQSRYNKETPEYKELSYRIKCGQLYQQNAIDKSKGIIAKPMPRNWHDRHAANLIEDPDRRKFYRDIVADKKPYFMRYIYPSLMKQYNTYVRNTNRNALREFQMTVDELAEIPAEKQTKRQAEFLHYYKVRLPVGTGDCVMNRICLVFEREFDGFARRASEENTFDYTIMKSGIKYSLSQKSGIKHLYECYLKRAQSYIVFSRYERADKEELEHAMANLKEEFLRACEEICQNNDVLCDIILDLCYQRNSSKRFAWDMCGDTIVKNLLKKKDGIISAPVEDPDGDIIFGGRKYTTMSVKVGGYEWE